MKKFILGMLSVILIIPVLENITEVILSWIEVAKLYPTKKVLKGNQEVLELQENLEPINTAVMGFQYEEPIEEDYYEDYEDKKPKNKIGFTL